jgi:putative transposase
MNQIDKLSANELSRLTGISRQFIHKDLQDCECEIISQNGGATKYFSIPSLPPKYQLAVVESVDIASLDLRPLCIEANLAALRKIYPIKETPSALSFKPPDLEGVDWNKSVAFIERIVQEALNVPDNYGKCDWANVVAHKYGVSRASVYRYLRKFKETGLAGLRHTKSTKGKPRAWTPEALEFWLGLSLKREHRKISKKALYQALQNEAKKRGWNIGSRKNAYWHLKQRVSPQLLALQNGGARELDNTLPPVLRNYADLHPNDIVVGDQHRFDFWVIDEETGEIFRPECYLWQQLRTRLIYGGAVGKKYDAQLMGLGLRIGVKYSGMFRALYTDNGKPELSHYIESLISEIDEGRHIRALYYNAKSKPIEGTFNDLEGVLRDVFLLPGYVKSLKDSKERQKVDEEETKRLAESGRLTTWREFVITFYNALGYYNNVKPHEGVQREWVWKPIPKKATPRDCLNRCIADGWKPQRLSDDAIDLLFLAREKRPRTVDRGRILFNNRIYEHEKLIPLHKKKVYLRFDPFDPEWVLVFHDARYLCRAEPVEYSSMRDKTLAQRKIHEKARLRKGFVDEYRKLTSNIPDIRQFSTVPAIEKAAALIGKDNKQKAFADREFHKTLSKEEIEEEIQRFEIMESERQNTELKPLERPEYFLNNFDRYSWIVKYEISGGILDSEDMNFKKEYERLMGEGEREHWEAVREVGE